MSVLVFLDQSEGHIKKSSFEAACYAAKVAEQLATTAEGIVLGNVSDDLAALGKYGLKKIYTVKNDLLNNLDAQLYTQVIAAAVAATNAKVIVFSNNLNGKAVASRLSARLKAGLVTGAVALPDTMYSAEKHLPMLPLIQI
jgi:electron transfer flavoprotein alpha subunit